MQQLLSIKNLTYNINYELPILEDITFNVEPADFISIIGPNGSGKTTLLKLLLGIKKPTGGTITFSKKYTNLERTNNGIGYVPQIKTLDKKFPATAFELVVTGITGFWNFIISNKNKQLAIEALEILGIKNLVNRQISDLSGGEIQRVYLARAIVRKPYLLLLDEPSTGVDFICEQDISEIISNLNKKLNITVLMVSHDTSAAYTHSSKILLLNKRIIYYGDPKVAFSDENMAKTFF